MSRYACLEDSLIISVLATSLYYERDVVSLERDVVGNVIMKQTACHRFPAHMICLMEILPHLKNHTQSHCCASGSILHFCNDMPD